jgi:UDP-N-acetylglucosamine:LPS N-acetylglucosamine transferase
MSFSKTWKKTNKRKRVLAVASGGGHWEQMQMLRDAFEGCDVAYMTTMRGLGERAGLSNVSIVPDCNRHRPVLAAWAVLRIAATILHLRPDVIITTGAMPGLIAIAIGRRLGARTVWIDSIANAEEFSMSGAKAYRHADLWLSQWQAVASVSGSEYAGSVL